MMPCILSLELLCSASCYENISYRQKPPVPAARTSVRAGSRPRPAKGKVSKENIGGPSDIQHLVHVTASSNGPHFNYFESEFRSSRI